MEGMAAVQRAQAGLGVELQVTAGPHFTHQMKTCQI